MNSIWKVPNAFKTRRFLPRYNFALAWPIVFVLVLVLITTWLHQRHLDKLQGNVTASYENKIITQHYLYELTNLFHLKRARLLTQGALAEGFAENARIEELLARYGETKLMSKDFFHLNDFMKNYAELSNLEITAMATTANQWQGFATKMNVVLDNIMRNMDALQYNMVTEHSQFMTTSKKTMDLSKFQLNIEIAFLVILGIIIQVILFHPRYK